MVQSLTMLPETAEIRLHGFTLKIQNHEIRKGISMAYFMMVATRHEHLWSEIIRDMERQKITYEAAVEQCVAEIESDHCILEAIFYWHYNIVKNAKFMAYKAKHGKRHDDVTAITTRISKSPAGRIIATWFVEKIRSCENWQEFYTEMKRESDFNRYTKSWVMREAKKQCTA